MYKTFMEKRPSNIGIDVYMREIMVKIDELIKSAGITTVHWTGSETNNYTKAFFMNNLKFSEYDAANFENWYSKFTRNIISSDGCESTSKCKTSDAIAFTVDEIKYVIMCIPTKSSSPYFTVLTNVITEENELDYMNKHYGSSYYFRQHMGSSGGSDEYNFYPFQYTEIPTIYTVIRDASTKTFIIYMKTKGKSLDKRYGFFAGHCGVENLGPVEMNDNIANLSLGGRLIKKKGTTTREEEIERLNPLKDFDKFDTETNVDLNNGKIYLQDCMIALRNYGIMGVLKELKFTTIHGAKELEPVSISGHTYYKLPYDLYWRSV